jgi:hypothetical protein
MTYDKNIIIPNTLVRNMASISFLLLAIIIIGYNSFTLRINNTRLKTTSLIFTILGITFGSGLNGPLGEYYYLVAEATGRYGFYGSAKFFFLISSGISIMSLIFTSEVIFQKRNQTRLTYTTLFIIVTLSLASAPWVYVPYWSGNLKPVQIPTDYLTVMNIVSSPEFKGRILFIPSSAIPTWLTSTIPDDPAYWIFSEHIYVLHERFNSAVLKVVKEKIISKNPENLISVLKKTGVSYILVRNDSVKIQKAEEEIMKRIIDISDNFNVLYKSEKLILYSIPDSYYINVENETCESINVKQFPFDKLNIENKLNKTIIVHISEVWNPLWTGKIYSLNGEIKQLNVSKNELGMLKITIPAKSAIVLYYQPSMLLQYINPIQIIGLTAAIITIFLHSNLRGRRTPHTSTEASGMNIEEE